MYKKPTVSKAGAGAGAVVQSCTLIILAYLVQASCNIRTLVPALFGR